MSTRNQLRNRFPLALVALSGTVRGSMKRRARPGLGVLACLLLAMPALANDVAPGSDLLETPPGYTFDIVDPNEPLPADFFGRGSAPWSGTIDLEGNPFPVPGPLGTETADTIVERLETAWLPDPNSSQWTVDIRILALNLVSVAPITVTFPNDPNDPNDPNSQYNVQVCLSQGATQPPGWMTITHLGEQGGLFDSSLPVIARLIFTKVSGSHGDSPVILDPAPQLVFNAANGCWSHADPFSCLYTTFGGFVDHDCDPNTLDVYFPPSSQAPYGFFPGICWFPPTVECKKLTPEQEEWASHGFLPAEDPNCPAVIMCDEQFGACCDDYTGVCEDNVQAGNCIPPLRFAQNATCAELDPMCGGIPGACCWPEGTCTPELPADCSGLWGGPFTECANVDCNNNGQDDFCDILSGCSTDCNRNGIPDACEVLEDCNYNAIPDICDIAWCEGEPWCRDCNENWKPDGCDIADGTSLDCQPDGIPDECQLGTGAPRDVPQWDDGSSENSLGLTAGGEMCWLIHFTVASPGTIQGIKTCFGTPLYPGSSGVSAGQPVRVYVWSDPNGDGNPTDAVFLSQATGVVNGGSIDSDVFQTVAINPPINGSFFVGASVVTTNGYPGPMDQNGPQYNQSWVTFNVVPFDPPNITANLYNMTDIGFPCNWLLRAEVTFWAPPNDCNGNGIPDECDIASGQSQDCQWDGVPDECQLEDNDCNANGIPDECDIASGSSEDLNGNGIPDECEPLCIGDLNCDGNIEFGDINPFVLYLSNFTAWQAAYPGCSAENGDINCDGTYGEGSFGDINPFVALIVQCANGCPCPGPTARP